MAVLSEKEARKLNALIRKRIKAEVELSWAGSKSPGEAVAAKADAADAKQALRAYIATMTE